MVESIARQSVIIKCNMNKSVLLGNYEFYYAGGLMNRIWNVGGSGQMQPQELSEYLLKKIPSLQPQDDQERYLLTLVGGYEPLPEYDQQMKELFLWGETEKDLWRVQTTASQSSSIT